MFVTRALTAAALLAAFLAILLWLDHAFFPALVTAVVALGAHEWGCLIGLARARRLVYAAFCTLLFGILMFGNVLRPVLLAAALFWFAAVPWWLSRGVKSGDRVWLGLAGLAVLLPAGLAMAVLPPRWLLIVMGLVWIADTAAYLVGGAIGKHKLSPSISPGKSWEGVAGAGLAALIYAIICAAFEPMLEALVQGAAWVPYLAAALLLCAAGTVGDLFESALKRQAGAKDSGTLLPGHGGVLDRIDSATAALPLALLLLQAIGAT